MVTHKYKVSSCDVVNQKKLVVFRKYRNQWLDEFCGKQYYSVQNQIKSMLEKDLTYRMINETKKISSAQNRGININPLVSHFIDRSYITMLPLAIRRLIDGRDDVVSLRRLLINIRDNRRIITRENYVCFDGLPYDYEAVLQKQVSKKHKGWIGTKNNWRESQKRHEKFDKLSKIHPSKRTRNDLIRVQLIECLEKKLQKCEPIRKFSHKYIAHMDNPKTRQKPLPKTQKTITLNRVERYEKIICEVASFLRTEVLYLGHFRYMPDIAIGYYRHLDEKWIDREDIGLLSDVSVQWRDKVNTWPKKTIWPQKY